MPTDVEAIDFKKLLRDKNCRTIDILKIDIEGAEKILFNDPGYMKDILAVTRVIGIEIHDQIVNRSAIISQLQNSGFILHDIGDMTFGYNHLLKK